MSQTEVPQFQLLRDQWALKYVINDDDIRSQFTLDVQANPNNEPNHNKKPRRGRAEVVSDLAFTFADKVLLAQYGKDYLQWLCDAGYREVWGVAKRTGVAGGDASYQS